MTKNIGADPDTCKHPPHRIYTSITHEVINDPSSREIMFFGCCDCGTGWNRLMPVMRKSTRKAL